jgi:hypothetical protein
MNTLRNNKLKNLNKNLSTFRREKSSEKRLITSLERYKLYEKLYFHELNRRENMVQRLSLPVVITIGLLGFCSYLLNNKPIFTAQWESITYWFFLLFSILTITIGLWFFRVVWIGYKDEMLPTPRSIENYVEKCKETYSDYPGDEDTDNALYNVMYEYFVQTTTKITMTNDKRSFNLFLVTVCLFLSMISSIIAYTPVFINQQKVDIYDEATTSATTSHEKR